MKNGQTKCAPYMPWNMCARVFSCFSHVWLFVTWWTIAHQASLSIGFSSKNTGVGCQALLQEIFPRQWSNQYLLQLLHCRQILYHWATRKPTILSHKIERSSNTGYNTDEPWKHDAQWKKSDTKVHILCDSTCRIGKAIGTEGRLVVASGWGRGKRQPRLNEWEVSFRGWWKL